MNELDPPGQIPAEEESGMLDIFDDPAKFALPQNYAQTAVRKVLLRIPVGKPNAHTFFRVHPEPEYRLDVLLLKHGTDRDMYLVVPTLRDQLENFAKPHRIYVYVTRDGNVGLWPVALAGSDGRGNAWWDSAHDAAARAMKDWLRVESNMASGCYDIFVPVNDGVFPPPEWPELTMSKLIRLGFKETLIDRDDHLVLKQLRGEA